MLNKYKHEKLKPHNIVKYQESFKCTTNECATTNTQQYQFYFIIQQDHFNSLTSEKKIEVFYCYHTKTT